MALTAEQIRTLKSQLDKRFFALCEEISGELRESDHTPYIELAGRVHDMGEASVADLLKDVQLASIDRHINEIRAIDAALIHIAKGTYGTCIDCEESIAPERLEVQPTALRCEACQEKWEKKPTAEFRRPPSL